MSRVKKIATLSLGQGINVVVNFLFLPYMARVFSYQDYGTYGQVMLVTSFSVALLSFGLPQIIYVYLNQEKDKRNVLISNLLSSVSLGLIGTFSLYLFADKMGTWLLNDQLPYYLKIYCFVLTFELANQILHSYYIFKEKVRYTVSVTVITNLIKVLMVVYVVQVHHSLEMALIAILISGIVRSLLLLIKMVDLQLPNKNSCQLAYAQLKKGFPLGLTGLLGTGILYIDGLMVSNFEGVQAFAIYRNGALEVPFIATIYGSIAAIIMPEVSKLFSEGKFKDIAILKKKVIMNSMMLIYPILIFLLFNSSDLILAYLGSKYESSAIIFAIFNLTLLIRVNDYHDVIVAANKSKIILYSYAMVFVLNVILNYFFISQFGIIGAAIATVISLLVFALLLLKKSLSLIQSSIKDVIDFKSLAKLLVFSTTFAFLLFLLTSLIDEKLIKLFVFAIIYFPLIYFSLYKSNLISSSVINNFISKKFKIA